MFAGGLAEILTDQQTKRTKQTPASGNVRIKAHRAQDARASAEEDRA
jgi:hypothetical protein